MLRVVECAHFKCRRNRKHLRGCAAWIIQPPPPGVERFVAVPTFDPVTLEVVGNYLISTVREMGTTLMRTAYSVVLREQMDCTTALFDPKGQLIAQADHVP